MLLIAASALEKAKNVPTMFWLKVALVILAIVLAILLVKWIATKIPKMILIAIAFVSSGVIFFSWIYNRNEPEFLTPVVNVLAQWFPSKGAYEVRQADEPGRPKQKSGPTPTKAPAKK